MLIVLVGLVPVVGYQVITSSWFLLSRITPLLEARLGGEVTVGSAAYLGGGRIHIHDVRVRARGVPGDAGEIFRVGQAALELDQAALWRGSWQIDRAVLDDVHIRLVEHAHEAGRFTFMALQPSMPTVESERPPSIELPQAVVELGVFDSQREGSQYEPLGIQRVAGTMYPRSGVDYEYDFELREIDEQGEAVEDGIFAKGSWNPSTFAHRARVDGVIFDERAKRMSPQVVRAWWEEMDLEGRLSEATVQFDGEDSFAISFTVEDTALKLPVGSEEDWVRFHEGQIIERTSRPRMHVERGEIRHERDNLTFDLRGELIGDEDQPALPYRVAATIEEIPALRWPDRREWMRHVLATVPFHMEFQMSEFRVTARADGSTPAVDLPHVIAEMLQRFQLTDWRIGTHVEVARGSPTLDETTGELVAGDLKTEGQVRIKDAVGMFDRFEYPLERVEAVVDFRRNAEENIVELVYLQGKGKGDVTVRVSGTITPKAADGEIDLELIAVDMPVDERLRTALGGVYLDLFNDLIHVPSFASLTEAGIIPDEDAQDFIESDLRSLRQQRRAVGDRMDEFDDETDEKLATQHALDLLLIDRKIRRLHRQREFGAFTLGGTVDLHLRFRRGQDETGDPALTGTIQIHSLSLLDRRFPYPFTITGGQLRWEPDILTIAKTESYPHGLPIRTPGGGHGFISGSVRQTNDESGERRIKPELTIALKEDWLNDAMLAAIPPPRAQRETLDDPERWAGLLTARSAQLLRDAGVAGYVRAEGTVTTDDDLQVQHDFKVWLKDGSAQPTKELAETIGAAGLLWPEGLKVRNLEGSLHVTRETIELHGLSGRHDTGTVEAAGKMELRADPVRAALDVNFRELALGRYLINLVPGENVLQAHELWDRYRPSGRFDATLSYRAIGDQPQPLELHVQPTRTDVVLDNEIVSLRWRDGGLLVRENTVEFHDLRMQMLYDDRDDGTIRLGGSYGMDPADDGLEVTGDWRDGTLESPLIIEVLRLIDADDQIEQYRAFRPAGRFHAQFEYASPRADGGAEYRMAVQPTDFEMTFRNKRIRTVLNEDARVEFTPGLIELHNLHGRFKDNHFQLGGLLRIDELPSMSVNVGYDGKLMDEQMLALLPSGARDVLHAIEFEDGERTTISNASLRLEQYREEDGSRAWRTRFDGQVKTSNASLNPGLRITELDSTTRIVFEHLPNQPVQFTMDVVGERLRIMDRKLTNLASGRITIDETGEAILIEDVRADSYGGAVAANGRVMIGSSREYELRLDLVGLSLEAMIADDHARDGLVADGTNMPGRADTMQRSPSGELFGNIKLQGVQGKEHTRSGRGSLRAMGGNLDTVPIILQLVHAMQFTIPLLHGDFDHADVSFYVDGSRAIFERILIESTFGEIASVQLIGHGEMDLNSFELDTEFRSRSALVLVRDFAGGLSDQLYVIEITGTLRDPEANLVPLPGLVRGLFGRAEEIAPD